MQLAKVPRCMREKLSPTKATRSYVYATELSRNHRFYSFIGASGGPIAERGPVVIMDCGHRKESQRKGRRPQSAEDQSRLRLLARRFTNRQGCMPRLL